MSTLAPSLQAYFTERLISQRAASSCPGTSVCNGGGAPSRLDQDSPCGPRATMALISFRKTHPLIPGALEAARIGG